MEEDRTELMSARALCPGHDIMWYSIKKVLGQGGFGITYLAHDKNLDRQVAIKEYLPVSFAFRNGDFSVKPLTGEHRNEFSWGLNGFLKEAQTLARFGHDNIVRVHSVFEMNNTAYMVMAYEQGDPLNRLYRRETGFDQAFLESVFFPIFDGLRAIHDLGFIHRDIKPSNVFIRSNGSPVLIDFGSARQTAHQGAGEMTALVSHGYTPLEQYSVNYGDQGPWTDIYALAATLFEGIVGSKPDESLSRAASRFRQAPDKVDELITQRHPGYSDAFLGAVHAGLALEPEARPATLDAWLTLFGAETTQTTPSNVVTRDLSDALDPTERSPAPVFREARVEPPDGRQQQSRMLRNGIWGAVLLAMVGSGWWLLQSEPEQSDSAIDAALLHTLPAPEANVATVLPKELVVRRVASLGRLAALYREAHTLQGSSEDLTRRIGEVSRELTSLAALWNASQHPSLSVDIIQALGTLPDSEEQSAQVASLVEQEKLAGPRADLMQSVEALMADGHYVVPAGQSVLDQVPSLNRAELAALRSTDAWATMMQTLRNAAVVMLKKAEFKAAADVVAAGLTIDPTDSRLALVRTYLDSSYPKQPGT